MRRLNQALIAAEFVEGTGYETRQTSKRDLFVRVIHMMSRIFIYFFSQKQILTIYSSCFHILIFYGLQSVDP